MTETAVQSSSSSSGEQWLFRVVGATRHELLQTNTPRHLFRFCHHGEHELKIRYSVPESTSNPTSTMPTTAPKRKKKPASFGGCASYTESEMDEFLKRQNLYRKPIAKDGSCLFRAVSEQVYQSQANHLDVRKECIDYMRRNKERFEEFVEGPFDHHLFRLQDPKEWAGQVEISALSLMYERDFVVYQDINAEPTKVTENRYKDKILLCYSNGNHYDAVYDIKYKKNAAFCQSLVYELLYKRVFPELDRGDTNRKGGLRTHRELQGLGADLYENGDMKDEYRENGNEDNDGWTEVKSRSQKAKSARQNRTAEQDEARDDSNVKQNNEQKYQWEIHRSVDAEQYRNVAIEVWEEDKNNQQHQDLAMAASIQYEANDRCYVLLGPPKVAEEKLYSAIVKEICTNQGTLHVYVPELKQRLNIPVQCLKPGDGHQGYRDLTGYYRKTGEGGSPASEDGFKDDGKGRRKKGPPRGRRGFNKGDEQEDGSQRRPHQEDFRPKPGGQREKFGRRGGRAARGREERNHKEEEDAKLQEQLKLEELREKDSKSFPALPSQQTEKKPAAPVIPVESAAMPVVTSTVTGTPAEFWSRLSSGSQKAKQATTPSASPAMSPTAPEAKANTPVAVSPGSPESKVPLSPTVLPSSPEVKVQAVPAVSPSQQPAPARVTTRDESSGGKVNREVKGKVEEGVKLLTTEAKVEKEASVVKGGKDVENRSEKETKGEKEGKVNKEARNETVNKADEEEKKEKKEKEAKIEQESKLDQEEKDEKMSTPRPEVKTPDTIAGTERPSFPGAQRVTHAEGVAQTRVEGVAPESDGKKKRPAEVKTNVSAADPGPRSLLKGLDAGKAKTPNVTKEPHETPVLQSERSAVTVTKLSTDAAEVKDGPVLQEANKTKADAVNSEPPKLQDVRPEGAENESARSVHGKVVNGVFIRHTEEKRVLKKDDTVPDEQPKPELLKPQPLISTESAPEKKTVKFAEPVKEEIEHRSFTAVPKGMLAVGLSAHARSSPPNTRKSGKNAAGKTGTEVARKGQAPKPSSPVPGVIPQDIPNLPVLPANHTEKTVSEDRSHRNISSPEITSRQSTQPAPESLLSAADMGGVQPSVSPQPQFQMPYAPFQTPNLTGAVQSSSGISVDPSGADLPQDVSTLRFFYNMGYQYFVAMQQMQQPMMYYPMWPSSQEHIQQQTPVAVSVGQQLYPGMQGMQHMYPPQALSAYQGMHMPSVTQDSVSSFDRSSNERNSPAQQTQQQMPSQSQSQVRQQNAQPISGQQQHTMNLHQQQQAAYVSHQLRPTPRSMFPRAHFVPHGHSAPLHQPRAPANSLGNPKPQYKRTKHNKPRGDAQSSYAGTQFHNQATAQFGMAAFPNASQSSASSSSQNYYLSADHSGAKGSGSELNPGTQPFMNYPGGLPANQRGQYS